MHETADPAGSTLGETYAAIRRDLGSAGIEDSGLEAGLILEQAGGFTALDRLRNPTAPLGAAARAAIGRFVSRRLSGEPIHRILGWREFYGRRFALSPETLVPRPDTEALVNLVLPWLRERSERGEASRFIDLGTGSGILAVTLAAETPSAIGVATDISAGALQAARANAEANRVADRLTFRKGDWWDGIDDRFDLIVSNPPYIGKDEAPDLAREVLDHDPHAALFAGRDGSDAYRIILDGAPAHLAAGGAIAVEIGHRQRQQVTALAESCGLGLLKAAKDLQDRDRALLFVPKESAALRK